MTRPMALAVTILFSGVLTATPPVASYIFPAGGQRGTKVPVRVGGLFLHDRSELVIEGPGVKADPALRPTSRIWYEGPIIPLPDSQQAEDYPVDRLSTAFVDRDALLGPRRIRLGTSQGVATGPLFIVGDLPEVIEREVDGDPIPQTCTLPVTANGRIFPRADIDLWSFALKKGETVTATAVAARIRSPLIPRLEIVDSKGRSLAESGPRAVPGSDISVRFTAPADDTFFAKISDTRGQGGPAFVYRLTLTKGPVLDAIFPLGGRRGTTVSFQPMGQALPSGTVKVTIPMDAPDKWNAMIPLGEASLPFALDVDNLPEFTGSDSTLVPPFVLNGRVDRATPSSWKLELKKATRYEFDLRARMLGSPLCAVVSVKDGNGRELVREMSADPGQDPTFTFQPEADGVFTVNVEERFRGRNGPEFAYRFRVREAGKLVPDFRLKVATDTVNVPRGGTAKLKVLLDRLGGFKEPVEVTIAGLPEGVKATPATIATGQSSFDITLSAEPHAPVRIGTVTITGRALKDPSFERTAMAMDSSTLFVAVAVPTPFKFTGEYTMNNSPRGQAYGRRYAIERNGFTGPITVSLADRQIRHLQGVTGPTITVPPEKSDFDYAVQLPPWIELGRTSRSIVMAVGEVKDPDGTKHTVCFTSGEQNHQLIVVPEPGRLGIDLAKNVIQVHPGRTLEVPFQVMRAKGLSEEALIEADIPAHWTGITAKPVRLNANQTTGTLELAIGNGQLPKFNMPLTIRARIGAVVAEAKLELFARE